MGVRACRENPCLGRAEPVASGGRLLVVTAETDEQRTQREQRRVLFGGVAELYDATRQSYPAEIVEAIFATAAVGGGAAVLEIGCGTGQLTRQVAGRGLKVTAIDISGAMIAAARRNVADRMVWFQACSFEDFAGSGPFDLIVSGTAFHWVDPGIGWAKAARLVRPGGWLALLSTGESYPEPLRTRLRELWIRYNHKTGTWADQPGWVTVLRETSLFGTPVEARHTRALRLPVETIMGVERTRATFLGLSEHDQASFSADLTTLLTASSHIDLAQETLLAMAPVTS